MFIQNFPFLALVAAIVYGAVFIWLRPLVEHMTCVTSLRILAYVAVGLCISLLTYLANVALVLAFGRVALGQRTEALWREIMMANIEEREAALPCHDLLDHAAWIQVRLHKLSYRLRRWEWSDTDDGKTQKH